MRSPPKLAFILPAMALLGISVLTQACVADVQWRIDLRHRLRD